MKNIIRDFLTFNKRERNGVFILVSIIFILVLYLNVSSMFISQRKFDLTKFDKEVKTFLAEVEEKKDVSASEIDQQYSVTQRTGKFAAERFQFDPNLLPDVEWRRLGLTDKQIRSIKKYESKGGKFRKKEDLKKMYCINEEQFLSLEPFINLSSQSIKQNEQNQFAQSDGEAGARNTSPVALVPLSFGEGQGVRSSILIELNTADSAQLTTIKGIGAFYAKNIIKYRNSVGGFISKEQLLEIWKFDAEKLASIEKYITIDPSKVKKLNITTCEAADLKGQYISWTLANGIVSYRKNHGKYKTVDEIKNTDLVDEETYRKIVPYLIAD